ncbi:MAG: alpha/beta fold hydrolase [Sulfobacillus thermotolerans]|nr:alpha/beta fold hydrolase [Sulfobacillus thermotolerans]
MKIFPVHFKSGGQEIRGLGYGPEDGVPAPFRAIVIHGYSSSKHLMDPVSTALAKAGYPVVSIDLPGHKLGASGGSLISFDMAVQAALDAHRQLTSPAPPVYIGHSMGAAAALVAGSLDPAAVGVASLGLGYPVTVMRPNPEVIQYYLERWAWVDGASPVEVGLAMDKALPQALEKLATRPFLLVSGSRDKELPPSSAAQLFAMAHGPKTHNTVDADHSGIPLLAAPFVVEWLNAVQSSRASS